MDWKVSLDRYLTTPPDDGFQDWSESVLDKIPESLYYENEDWFDSVDGVCVDWLNKLFDKEVSADVASKIIERAFRIYIKGQ